MAETDELLATYLDRYWGYGSLDAPWWFVGMEEGGDPDWDDFVAFLQVWEHRGAPPIRPFRPPPTRRGHHRWFGARPRLQPYWAKLIRIRLAAEGLPCDTDAVRAYQASDLAAPHGDTCLLELLPLPAPSTAAWPYGTHSDLDVLADRETYRADLAPRRVERLRAMIAEHQPAYVVFLGSSYRRWWEQVAGRPLPVHPAPAVTVGAGTRMIISRHPAARGATNTEFEQLGRALATA